MSSGHLLEKLHHRAEIPFISGKRLSTLTGESGMLSPYLHVKIGSSSNEISSCVLPITGMLPSVTGSFPRNSFQTCRNIFEILRNGFRFDEVLDPVSRAQPRAHLLIQNSPHSFLAIGILCSGTDCRPKHISRLRVQGLLYHPSRVRAAIQRYLAYNNRTGSLLDQQLPAAPA